jgi:hypothetical protein
MNSIKCYRCSEIKCGRACGTSIPIKIIMGEKDTKKYLKEREEIINEYIDKAIKIPHMAKELMSPKIFKELSKFKTTEEAFNCLGEFQSMILCMDDL